MFLHYIQQILCTQESIFSQPTLKQYSHIIKNKMQTIDKRDQCAIYTHDRKFLFHLPRETFKHGKNALPQNIKPFKKWDLPTYTHGMLRMLQRSSQCFCFECVPHALPVCRLPCGLLCCPTQVHLNIT